MKKYLMLCAGLAGLVVAFPKTFIVATAATPAPRPVAVSARGAYPPPRRNSSAKHPDGRRTDVFPSPYPSPCSTVYASGVNNYDYAVGVTDPSAANVAGGAGAVVAGGNKNEACDSYTGIGSGYQNGIGNSGAAEYSFIGGGYQNGITAEYASIGGGYSNQVTAMYGVLGGGTGNGVGDMYSFIGSGSQNSIYAPAEYSFIGGGQQNLIAGTIMNESASSIVGGSNNSIFGSGDNFIGGGYGNKVDNIATYAAVVGGENNLVANFAGGIVGGYNNEVTGPGSFIGAGGSLTNGNEVTGIDAFVGAGDLNYVTGNGSFIGAGGVAPSSMQATYAKKRDLRRGRKTSIGGDFNNEISGSSSFIGAGQYNNVVANEAFLGSGSGNTIDGTGTDAVLGGGRNNTAGGNGNFLGGGLGNSAGDSASYSVLGGGYKNGTSGSYSTLGGGASNAASGEYAAVLGGIGNTASGEYAVAFGGDDNTAAGELSFAGGFHTDAANAGSFVWSDFKAQSSILKDSAADQFLVRASGGVYFYSNEAATSGVMLPAGSGTWASLSDRNAKTDIAPLDDDAILAKVATLPVSAWSYKSESGVRHVGPMAQDFYAAFGTGADDRHISSLDEDGVALAAIKSLSAKLERSEAQNRRLERRLDLLASQMRAHFVSQALSPIERAQ